jgi:hypothetical protein
MADHASSVPMVEQNHDEERLARIERMLESVQREQATAKVITAKLVLAVAVLAPKVASIPRKS